MTGIGDLVEDLISNYFDRDRDRLQLDIRSPDMMINVDEARITLLLKNLVSNALRYAPEDSGLIELSVRTSTYEVLFRVQDHGPGIAPEHAAHIGEPFYRGDPSRTRETGGTGLGLYLASLVAQAHGGSLRLVDRGVGGACFDISLPLSLNS